MVQAIRRACKYGIEYVTSLPSGAYVHYVLDEIVMANVLAKAETALWVGTVGVPITTSELRYLFRNWHHFQHKRIQFYLGYGLVPPPWATEPQRWYPYAKHLVDKFLHSPTTNQGRAGLFYLAGIQHRYADAIQIFHTMPLTAPK